MMDEWIWAVRWLHIVGACVLLGTGAGIAFFMVMAHRTSNPAMIAHTAAIVVIADMVFTASAAILQPITGLALAHAHGWAIDEGWILASIGLYLFVGVFWLPVVWIQIRLRNEARIAAFEGISLSARYHRLYRIWFFCGFPAFIAMLAIVWLMIVKPVF